MKKIKKKYILRLIGIGKNNKKVEVNLLPFIYTCNNVYLYTLLF